MEPDDVWFFFDVFLIWFIFIIGMFTSKAFECVSNLKPMPMMKRIKKILGRMKLGDEDEESTSMFGETANAFIMKTYRKIKEQA